MAFFMTSDGLRIYYKCANLKSRRAPMVFIHGFVVSSVSFDKEYRHFRKKGYPVITFDLRGHGRSDVPERARSFSIERISQDIHELLIQLGAHRSVILVGHSLGGIVCSHYAKKSERVKKMVLINTIAKLPDKLKFLKNVARTSIVKHLFRSYLTSHKKRTRSFDLALQKRELDMNPKLFFIKCLLTSDIATIFYLGESVCGYKPHLKSIRCPLLIIESDRDEMISNDAIHRFSRKMPNAVTSILPCGHDTPVSMPRQVIKEISNFIG
jgi:non-heme chloroperoxidase